VIAAAGGVLIGAVLAALPVASKTFAGVIQAAYATPLIALAPLLVVLFGIGLESKVIVVFLLAVFPVIIATESAFRTVNPEYVETARAFGAGRLQVVAKVVFPAAAVGVLTGLRLGVGRGIIGVVVGEIFGAQRGLGFLIVQYSEAFRTADVLAVVLLLAAIGVGTNSALRKLEDRLSPWTRSAGPRRTA
jgi:NitT/TauT family transport system permease protein